jgi:hypothetical protein
MPLVFLARGIVRLSRNYLLEDTLNFGHYCGNHTHEGHFPYFQA